MDSFNEELFRAREWLVKVDARTSIPYLFVRVLRSTTLDLVSYRALPTIPIGQKFHSSPVDLTCCIMITDTKRTWAEALSSKQFARRWRECNRPNDSPLLGDDEEEEAWRTRSLDLLASAHTLGGMPDLSFEVAESKFGDYAFQFECHAFKWRWEAVFVGYKISAEVLSRHLIMPLISVNHLAFTSPDVIGDLPPTDLEKAIDKVARTARRSVDTHVKNALSKPRLATTIRRTTAVLNFISEPPDIVIDANSPVLLPPEPMPKIEKSPMHLKSTRTLMAEPNDRGDISGSRRPSSTSHAADSGSATEPEDDCSSRPSRPVPETNAAGGDQQADIRMRSPTQSGASSPRPSGTRSRSLANAPSSDTESSPVRPIKKSKPRMASSDEDSEEERKKLVTQIRRGTAVAPGLRQPIKRGGKRF